ncbi:MAG: glycoside hydrolase family 2 TIM barrel-domain containing protein [candidate division KSB1 bacterium]|nr:glycoside hydrolase family 2 TIM barrel-domain containing protein [candidate division KSB1 bacterium]
MTKFYRQSWITSIGIILIYIFAANADAPVPRPEHPKPQFKRSAWLNLNGQWNFAFDFDEVGIEEEWQRHPSVFQKTITVPFCPESRLSGIEYTDIIPAVWYHRSITIPEEWQEKRIFLHFGGVDYECRAWVNQKPVGRHYGGAVSFEFEITDAMIEGTNEIVVCATDHVRSGIQPVGKQSKLPEPDREWSGKYNRTTGIWQTVWLEAKSQNFISRVFIFPDLDQSRFVFQPIFDKNNRNLELETTLHTENGKMAAQTTSRAESGVPFSLILDNPQVWSPDHPHLYDISFKLIEKNKIIDEVQSYAGLRKFHTEGNRLFLNNEPFFLRFVLDQGFYPDGIWTAPSDNDLRQDIERALAVGFNGARLHQKVFEERFHYWADKLGYLTAGEFYDKGMDFGQSQAIQNHQREWREAVMRDFNHPSILFWTPFNETSKEAQKHPEAHRRAVQSTVDLTRLLDLTRPVHDASGFAHVDTDIYSSHTYQQHPDTLRKDYHSLQYGRYEGVQTRDQYSVPYEGQPFIVAEYGGIFWDEEAKIPSDPRYWGFGKGTYNEVEKRKRQGRWFQTSKKPTKTLFLDLLMEQTMALLENPYISGFCYTQLYDIEGEVNGIYTYDRKLKFDRDRLEAIFTAPNVIYHQ